MLADIIACLKISGMYTGAGHNQITDTGQSHKGFRFAAQCDAIANHFRKPTRNQGSLGIIPIANAALHTAGNRDGIFQCNPDFTSNLIIPTINTQIFIGKQLLYSTGILFT